MTQRVCFVAAPETHPKTAVFKAVVETALHEAADGPIRCVFESGELGRAVDRAEAVLLAIKRADFAILLFDGTEPDLTLSLGIMLALAKPLLLVRACELSELPKSLAHRYWVEFNESDEGENDLRVAVQAFLASTAALASGQRTPSDNCVFICHRSTDKAQVRPVAAALLGLGYHVWYDSWSIRAGDAITKEIQRGLSEATHFLIFLSTDTVDSAWVSQELEAALTRALNEGQPRLIPVFLDEAGRKATPLLIQGRRGISIYKSRPGAAVDELIDVIESERRRLDSRRTNATHKGP